MANINRLYYDDKLKVAGPLEMMVTGKVFLYLIAKQKKNWKHY